VGTGPSNPHSFADATGMKLLTSHPNGCHLGVLQGLLFFLFFCFQIFAFSEIANLLQGCLTVFVFGVARSSLMNRLDGRGLLCVVWEFLGDLHCCDTSLLSNVYDSVHKRRLYETARTRPCPFNNWETPTNSSVIATPSPKILVPQMTPIFLTRLLQWLSLSRKKLFLKPRPHQ